MGDGNGSAGALIGASNTAELVAAGPTKSNRESSGNPRNFDVF